MKIRGAFTLIELLVVIAIIAVLAALIFPVLSAIKARARRTVCMNNLKQISYGIHLYSADSSDSTPSLGVDQANTNHSSLYWGYKELMKNYVGLNGASSAQDKLFACPADKFFPGFVYPDPNYTNDYVKKSLHDDAVFDYSSYAFNGGDNVSRTFRETNQYSSPGLTGVKYSSVNHPERTLLVTEVSALVPWSWHEPSSRLVFPDAKNMVSFVDGHVGYIRIYWNSKPLPGGGVSFAMGYNPPAGYDYQWSAD